VLHFTQLTSVLLSCQSPINDGFKDCGAPSLRAHGDVSPNFLAVSLAVVASGHEQPFRYFNRSSGVIRLVVMMYVRYPLSLRFGPMFAAEIKKKRLAQALLQRRSQKMGGRDKLDPISFMRRYRKER